MSVFDRPADRLLMLLRERGPDAYRACPDLGRWVARCPLCGEDAALQILEREPGADVTVFCGRGCNGADVLAVLTNPAPAADPWAFTDELLDLARRQQRLIQRLAPDEGQAA